MTWQKAKDFFDILLLPFLIGLAFTIISCWLGFNRRTKGLEDILGSIIQFSSIVIGFYSALYGILVTFRGGKTFSKIREENLKDEFKYQLSFSLYWSFVSLIFSIFMQGFKHYNVTNIVVNGSELSWDFSRYIFIFWTFFIGVLFGTSFLTIQLLLKIILKEFVSDSDDLEQEKIGDIFDYKKKNN